jgi:hypothetical protein
LVEPPDLPPGIVLRWPQKPSVTTPDAYANAAMQVLSAAVIELAAIVSGRRSCEPLPQNYLDINNPVE